MSALFAFMTVLISTERVVVIVCKQLSSLWCSVLTSESMSIADGVF